MRILFSIISLLSLVSIALWWSAKDMSLVEKPTVTVGAKSNVLAPIDAALDAKRSIEGSARIELDLSNQGLTKTPNSIFDRTDLEILNLSNNNMSGALQAEVRHLQELRILDLSNNKFTGVPAEIGQLVYLEELNLSNNQITGLPHELGNLKNLKILNIKGNNFSKVDLEVIKKSLPETATILE